MSVIYICACRKAEQKDVGFTTTFTFLFFPSIQAPNVK